MDFSATTCSPPSQRPPEALTTAVIRTTNSSKSTSQSSLWSSAFISLSTASGSLAFWEEVFNDTFLESVTDGKVKTSNFSLFFRLPFLFPSIPSLVKCLGILERCFMHQAALYFLLFKWIVVFSHVAQNKVGSRHGTQLAAANPQFVHLTLGPIL